MTKIALLHLRIMVLGRRLARIERRCKRDVTKAKKAKKSRDEIDGLQPHNDFDWCDITDDRNVLNTRILCIKAHNLDVEIPDYFDKTAWEDSSITNKRYLTLAGRRAVRAAIRVEKKERSESLRLWLPAILSIAAALAAWIAALKK